MTEAPRDDGGAEPRDAPSQAAFFDFDHTLLDGDAGVIFGWTLAEWIVDKRAHGLEGRDRQKAVAAAAAQIAAIVSKGTFYRSLNAIGLMKRSRLIELTYAFMKGLPADEMSKRMERVWNDKLQQRVYPKMKQVLEDHRKAGRRIVIVTTGMRELVDHSKKALGHDIEIIGVEMLSEGGFWLGKVEGPLYGVHKAEAVRRWAQYHNVDLAESWAYSDHYSDSAFLALVGHPVAVNPGVRLRVLARKRGWDVVNVLPPSRHRDAEMDAP